jgi:hypothetical protein
MISCGLVLLKAASVCSSTLTSGRQNPATPVRRAPSIPVAGIYATCFLSRDAQGFNQVPRPKLLLGSLNNANSVTGSAGFIGFLARRLLDGGQKS